MLLPRRQTQDGSDTLSIDYCNKPAPDEAKALRLPAPPKNDHLASPHRDFLAAAPQKRPHAHASQACGNGLGSPTIPTLNCQPAAESP